MSEGDQRKKYNDNKSYYQGTKYNYNRGRGGHKSQYPNYVVKKSIDYTHQNQQTNQPNYDQEINKSLQVTVYSIRDLLDFFQKDEIPNQMNLLRLDFPDLFNQKSHIPVNFDKSISTPCDANELFVQITRGGNNGNRQDNRDRGPPRDYSKKNDFYEDEDKEPAWMTTNIDQKAFEFKSFDKEKLKNDFKSRLAQPAYVQPEYIPGENQKNENAFEIFLQSKQFQKDKPNELLIDIDQMLEQKYQQEKKDENQFEEGDQQDDLSAIKPNEESSGDEQWDSVDEKDKQEIIQQNIEKKQKIVEYNKVEPSYQTTNEKNSDQPKLEDRFSILKNFLQPLQKPQEQVVIKNPVPISVNEIEKNQLIQQENNTPIQTRDPWVLSNNEPQQNKMQLRSKLLQDLNITPSPGKSNDLLENHFDSDLTPFELKINKFENNNITKIFDSVNNGQVTQNKPQSPCINSTQDSMQIQQQMLSKQSQPQQQQIIQPMQIKMMEQQQNLQIQLQQQQQEQLSQRISVLEFKRDSNLQKSLAAPFNSYTSIQYPNDINAWYYIDQKNFCQGPFTSEQMDIWYNNNYFMDELLISFMERERQNFFQLKRLKEYLVQSIKASFQQQMEYERNNYLAIMGQWNQILQQTTQSQKQFQSLEEIEQYSQQMKNSQNYRNFQNQQYNKPQQNYNASQNYPQYQQINQMGMNYSNQQSYNAYQQQQIFLQQQMLHMQQLNQSQQQQQYVRKNSGFNQNQQQQNLIRKNSKNNSAQLMDESRNYRQYQQQGHPLIFDVYNIENEKDISIRSNQDLSSEVKYNVEDFPSLGESMKQ